MIGQHPGRQLGGLGRVRRVEVGAQLVQRLEIELWLTVLRLHANPSDQLSNIGRPGGPSAAI
jgi:hypothetical protein